MLLFQLGCLRKYAEICFGKLSKICDMCKIFFTGLFFILWGVDQNSGPVMVLNRFGMMDIGVADECGSTLYFGRSDEVPGNVFQYCSNLIVFDRQGGILESYRLDTDLIALCYAPDEQRWYGKRLSAGDHPDVSVFIPIDK